MLHPGPLHVPAVFPHLRGWRAAFISADRRGPSVALLAHRLLRLRTPRHGFGSGFRRLNAFTLAFVCRLFLPFLFAPVIPLLGLGLGPVITSPLISTTVTPLLRYDNPVFKPVVQSVRDRTRTAIIVHIVGNIVDINDARNIIAIAHFMLAAKARR